MPRTTSSYIPCRAATTCFEDSTWRTSEQNQCHWNRVSAGWVSTPVKQRAGCLQAPTASKGTSLIPQTRMMLQMEEKWWEKIHIFQEDFSLNWFCSIKFGCSFPSQCYPKSCKSWKRWLTVLPLSLMFPYIRTFSFSIFFFTTTKTNEAN